MTVESRCAGDPTDVAARVDVPEPRKAVKKSVDLDHASANHAADRRVGARS